MTPPLTPLTPAARLRGWSVHLLTASGVVFMFLAAAELTYDRPRAWLVFVWFAAATLVDALDGPLARRWDVKRTAPNVSGRTIDDIVDYLGFTFLPLVLVWRMGWVPGGGQWWGGVWVVIPMMASLLGFAHKHAKDEAAGFFRGFPSYWNLAAFYLGLVAYALPTIGPWLNAIVLLILAVLTISPVWMVYPNLAPKKWKPAILWGSYAWALAVLLMLPWYPAVPAWLWLATLIYPAFYAWLSYHLRDRWPARHATTDQQPV